MGASIWAFIIIKVKRKWALNLFTKTHYLHTHNIIFNRWLIYLLLCIPDRPENGQRASPRAHPTESGWFLTWCVNHYVHV